MAKKSLLLDFLKKKRDANKGKNQYIVRQREQEIFNELNGKLDRLLKDNDEIMIEVEDKVLNELMTVLNGPLIKNKYSYEQISRNQFIFKSQEIIF